MSASYDRVSLEIFVDTRVLVKITKMTGTCRLCLKESSKLSPIFCNKQGREHFFDLYRKIFICCGIEINEYDELSSFICNDCVTKLNAAYDFRLVCQRSNSSHCQLEKHTDTCDCLNSNTEVESSKVKTIIKICETTKIDKYLKPSGNSNADTEATKKNSETIDHNVEAVQVNEVSKKIADDNQVNGLSVKNADGKKDDTAVSISSSNLNKNAGDKASRNSTSDESSGTDDGTEELSYEQRLEMARIKYKDILVLNRLNIPPKTTASFMKLTDAQISKPTNDKNNLEKDADDGDKSNFIDGNVKGAQVDNLSNNDNINVNDNANVPSKDKLGKANEEQIKLPTEQNYLVANDKNNADVGGSKSDEIVDAQVKEVDHSFDVQEEVVVAFDDTIEVREEIAIVVNDTRDIQIVIPKRSLDKIVEEEEEEDEEEVAADDNLTDRGQNRVEEIVENVVEEEETNEDQAADDGETAEEVGTDDQNSSTEDLDSSVVAKDIDISIEKPNKYYKDNPQVPNNDSVKISNKDKKLTSRKRSRSKEPCTVSDKFDDSDDDTPLADKLIESKRRRSAKAKDTGLISREDDDHCYVNQEDKSAKSSSNSIEVEVEVHHTRDVTPDYPVVSSKVNGHVKVQKDVSKEAVNKSKSQNFNKIISGLDKIAVDYDQILDVQDDIAIEVAHNIEILPENAQSIDYSVGIPDDDLQDSSDDTQVPKNNLQVASNDSDDEVNQDKKLQRVKEKKISKSKTISDDDEENFCDGQLPQDSVKKSKEKDLNKNKKKSQNVLVIKKNIKSKIKVPKNKFKKKKERIKISNSKKSKSKPETVRQEFDEDSKSNEKNKSSKNKKKPTEKPPISDDSFQDLDTGADSSSPVKTATNQDSDDNSSDFIGFKRSRPLRFSSFMAESSINESVRNFNDSKRRKTTKRKPTTGRMDQKQVCKYCGTSYLYRKPLFKHMKQQHGIDSEDLIENEKLIVWEKFTPPSQIPLTNCFVMLNRI